MLKSDIAKLFVRNRKRAELDYKTENEDIRKLNIDDIISEAIKNKNFKRAVRYLYLELLKELDKRELILWKINKTNRDYANELAKRNLKKEFKELSLYYEYVWYGDFEISEIGFENIKIVPDLSIPYVIENYDINMIVFGTDGIYGNGILLNKIGTKTLTLIGKYYNITIIVICEDFKFSNRKIGRDDVHKIKYTFKN